MKPENLTKPTKHIFYSYSYLVSLVFIILYILLHKNLNACAFRRVHILAIAIKFFLIHMAR